MCFSLAYLSSWRTKKSVNFIPQYFIVSTEWTDNTIWHFSFFFIFYFFVYFPLWNTKLEKVFRVNRNQREKSQSTLLLYGQHIFTRFFLFRISLLNGIVWARITKTLLENSNVGTCSLKIKRFSTEAKFTILYIIYTVLWHCICVYLTFRIEYVSMDSTLSHCLLFCTKRIVVCIL